MPRANKRDPQDPRVILGRALRRLREKAGHATQDAFGLIIHYSQDAISGVETGARAPSERMYRAWLTVCAPDPLHQELLDELFAHIRRLHGPVPQFFELYHSREKLATHLYLWCLDVLSGLLQVYEYAYGMYLREGLDEDEAAELAEVRGERRQHIEGKNPKQVVAIIHESVLYSQVCDPAGMARQMQHLLDLSRRPNVILQVVRDTGYFPGKRGQFAIASGLDIPTTLLMYNVEDQTQDDSTLVAKALAAFERIRSHAAPVEESRCILQEARDHWNRQQAHPGASPATAATAGRAASK